MADFKKTLHLNSDAAKFLGVCAGLADYLGVDAWKLRVVLVVAVLFGAWFLVPAYFVVWLLMGKDGGDDFSRRLSENKTVNHFKNVDYKKGLYRNSREGKFLGVCAGIADYLEVDALWVRLLALVVFFSGFGFIIPAYFIAYFMLDEKPAPKYAHHNAQHRKDEETLNESATSSRYSIKHCARKFSALQSRLIRMEAYVTSSKFRVNQAINNIE